METTNFFEEDYDRGKFADRYKDIEGASVTGGPANWDIADLPENEQKEKAINNNSEIEDKNTNPEFATKLIRSDFETSNGVMKTNIQYMGGGSGGKDIAGQTGLFFRYYDKTNFYVIKFNMPGRPQIEFFKVVNDEEHLLGSKKDIVRFGIWYYYYISFYND